MNRAKGLVFEACNWLIFGPAVVCGAPVGLRKTGASRAIMGTQKVTQDGCKAFKYRLIYILRVSPRCG